MVILAIPTPPTIKEIAPTTNKALETESRVFCRSKMSSDVFQGSISYPGNRFSNIFLACSLIESKFSILEGRKSKLLISFCPVTAL